MIAGGRRVHKDRIRVFGIPDDRETSTDQQSLGTHAVDVSEDPKVENQFHEGDRGVTVKSTEEQKKTRSGKTY